MTLTHGAPLEGETPDEERRVERREQQQREEPREERRMHSTIVDPRIDRFISWFLMFVASAALSVGAWFFAGLTHGMDDLQKEVVALRLDLKGTEGYRREIDEMKKELAELRKQLYERK